MTTPPTRSRVLFISHLPDWGGAQHWLYLLVKGLDRTRFEPTVLVGAEGVLAARVRELGVPTRILPLCWWVRDIEAFAHASLRERVETLADLIYGERFDLVMSNTLAVLDGALAARLYGVPHVWSVHEMLSRDPALACFLEPAAVYRLLAVLAERIVGDSHAVAEEIMRHAPETRVAVVHTGLEPAGEPPRPSRKEELFGWPSATPVVTFVGHLSMRKGIVTLSDAIPLVLRRFPDARFAVVGPGADAAEEFRRRLMAHGTEAAVRWLDTFRDDLTDILASSDVFVLPSVADPFPVVLLEAMRCGLPVVATRSGGAEELVEHGVTGRLVPVGDAGALAEAIAALLAEPAARVAMGQAGRARLEERFPYSGFIRGMEQVLSEALAADQSRRPWGPAVVWPLVDLLQQGAENWVARRRLARLEEELAGWERWRRRVQATLPYRVYRRVRSLGRRMGLTHPVAVASRETPAGRPLAEAVPPADRPRCAVLLPVYRADPESVLRTVRTLEAQLWPPAEILVLADAAVCAESLAALAARGPRSAGTAALRVKSCPGLEAALAANLQNAVGESTGDWVAWVAAGDELTPDALLELARFLRRHPDAAAVYSDEQGWAWDDLHATSTKPEWSPELLRALNYPCNLLAVRREWIMRAGLEGRHEDDIRYDLLLKLAEAGAAVRHLPRVLYRRQLGKRDHPDGYSFDRALEAERAALARHLGRMGAPATVEPGLFSGAHRVRYGHPLAAGGRDAGGGPVVSIVIPTRDRLACLRRCVTAIESRTAWRDFEIVLVDNASAEEATREYLRACGHRVLRVEEPFNYSRLNNLGAAQARGAYLLFLNNDTEPLDAEWLEALLEQARRPDVGAVGGKLIYPSGMVQHTGVFVDADLEPKVGNWRIKVWEHGWAGTADVVHEVAAVIGACLMMERALFEAVGGFDEQMTVMWSDTDLCFKARERGRRSIYTPYARLVHHEGVSHTVAPARERADRRRFLARWKDQLVADARWGAAMMAWTLGRADGKPASVEQGRR